MGAWIETGATAIIVLIVSVAPYMGAWIETLSHPIWVRGLKRLT